jgi:hypothetical protein
MSAGRAVNSGSRPCFLSAAASTNEKFGHPAHLRALLQPDGNGTGPYVVHHHCAGLVNAVGDLADPDRPDSRVAMEPCQGRTTRTRELAADKGGPVLQGRQATGVKAPGKLMDRPDPGKYLHGRLHCGAGDCADLRHVVDGTQRRGSCLAARRQRWRGWPARRMSCLRSRGRPLARPVCGLGRAYRCHCTHWFPLGWIARQWDGGRDRAWLVGCGLAIRGLAICGRVKVAEESVPGAARQGSVL